VRGILPGVDAGKVETERLLLRRWRPDTDAEAFAAVNAQPAVMRFIPPFRPMTRAESDALLERVVAHWDEHGYGLWAVERRDDGGGCVGFAGLAVPAFLPEVLPTVEVGWRLHPSCWGRGLATEAARASVRHGAEALGLASVVSIIDPLNAASLRVAAKLGMRAGRDRVHPATRRRLKVFEMDLRPVP
jgi:RimJ/RimL family protein N-acetyltransferase